MRGCFCTDYCQTRLVVGRGYGDYHAGVKARFEAVFEILDDVRVLVGGKDQLFVVVMQKIEEVEELLFDFVASGQKLHIVHDKEVVLPVFFLETLHLPCLQGGHIVHREALRSNIKDLPVGRVDAKVVANSLYEVCFAQTSWAINQERVVSSTRLAHHCMRRRACELIKRPDDKGGEGKPRIKIAFLVHSLQRKLAYRRRHHPGLIAAVALGAAGNDILDGPYRVGESAQRAQNILMKLGRKPVPGELRRDAERHRAILDADDMGVAKPRIKVWF